MPSTVKQASPGVLEKDEMVPDGLTEPTTSRLLGASRPSSHGTLAVWVTPSLPAALTMTRSWLRLLSSGPDRIFTHSWEKVQPGTPSDAFTTDAPFLYSASIPVATSFQLAVPVA